MKIVNIVILAGVVISVAWFGYEQVLLRTHQAAADTISAVELTAGETTSFTIGKKAAETAEPVPAAENQVSSVTVTDAGEGDVTMSVKYVPSLEKTFLEVALNSHSVDTDDVIFKNQVVIEKDGQTISAKISTEEGEGHHRGSQMEFPRVETPFTVKGTDIAGIPLRELIIKGTE